MSSESWLDIIDNAETTSYESWFEIVHRWWKHRDYRQKQRAFRRRLKRSSYMLVTPENYYFVRTNEHGRAVLSPDLIDAALFEYGCDASATAKHHGLHVVRSPSC